MKTFLMLILVILLSTLPLNAVIQPPKGFDGKLWAGTLALYGTKSGDTSFLCTAEPIAKIEGGYQLLTAGHCIQDVPEDVKFSVADDIGGPQTSVSVIKAYEGDGIDFALLELKTDKKYVLFVLAPDNQTQVGDAVIVPNFALGIGKQLSIGIVSSRRLVPSDICDTDSCAGKFLVQVDGGPGASGSAVISQKTHRVIGLLVESIRVEDGEIGFAVESIALFPWFMDHAGQPHPKQKVSSDDPH